MTQNNHDNTSAFDAETLVKAQNDAFIDSKALNSFTIESNNVTIYTSNASGIRGHLEQKLTETYSKITTKPNRFWASDPLKHIKHILIKCSTIPSDIEALDVLTRILDNTHSDCCKAIDQHNKSSKIEEYKKRIKSLYDKCRNRITSEKSTRKETESTNTDRQHGHKINPHIGLDLSGGYDLKAGAKIGELSAEASKNANAKASIGATYEYTKQTKETLSTTVENTYEFSANRKHLRDLLIACISEIIEETASAIKDDKKELKLICILRDVHYLPMQEEALLYESIHVLNQRSKNLSFYVISAGSSYSSLTNHARVLSLTAETSTHASIVRLKAKEFLNSLNAEQDFIAILDEKSSIDSIIHYISIIKSKLQHGRLSSYECFCEEESLRLYNEVVRIERSADVGTMISWIGERFFSMCMDSDRVTQSEKISLRHIISNHADWFIIDDVNETVSLVPWIKDWYKQKFATFRAKLDKLMGKCISYYDSIHPQLRAMPESQTKNIDMRANRLIEFCERNIKNPHFRIWFTIEDKLQECESEYLQIQSEVDILQKSSAKFVMVEIVPSIPEPISPTDRPALVHQPRLPSTAFQDFQINPPAEQSGASMEPWHWILIGTAMLVVLLVIIVAIGNP